MHIQIVNFHLAGIGEEEFRAMSDQLAPAFAEVPGLISKTWLADAASNTYGGVYLWDTEASCRNYKASELFNAVKTHPNFAEVSSREFGVLDGPSRITRAVGPALATA
jgi:heme-degrading monooxygenase HmoA